MKIALITGGSRGVGKSTALNVAKRGKGVIVTYNSYPEGANEVVAEIKKAGGKAAALKLDVGRISTFAEFAGALTKTLEKVFGVKTFDYLVNNAGIAQRTLLKDLKEQEFDELVNVHFKGPVFLTQILLPLMNDGGHIVNISSGLTRMTHEGISVYAAVKGAMEVMTKYMAKEFGARKIRSNIVAPGAALLSDDFRWVDGQRIEASGGAVL